MAKKPTKAPWASPKRETSNTKQAKDTKKSSATKPSKGCKCGGHG